MNAEPQFVEGIRELIAGARATVARGVDLMQVHTNFEIGRRIVEEEQRGEDRAAYGEEVLRMLAERLTGEFGRGFSYSSLKSMRLFYLQNQERIGQTASGQFSLTPIRHSLADELGILQTLSGISGLSPSGQSVTGQSSDPAPRPFTLGWSHYVFNYFDRFVKTGEENATIGILLCKRKNQALVEITLPKDANIHAREYQLYLPSKDELQQKLMEWIGERGRRDGG